jgi:hypothetical protein
MCKLVFFLLHTPGRPVRWVRTEMFARTHTRVGTTVIIDHVGAYRTFIIYQNVLALEKLRLLTHT